MLREAGRVERCQVHEERRQTLVGGGCTATGRPKGTATATFRTTDEAHEAIRRFDKRVVLGRAIRCRFDKEGGSKTAAEEREEDARGQAVRIKERVREKEKENRPPAAMRRRSDGPLVVNGGRIAAKLRVSGTREYASSGDEESESEDDSEDESDCEYY